MSRMKIEPDHLEYLQSEIEGVLKVHNSKGELVDAYQRGEFHNAERTKDLQRRFCFDVLYATGLSKWVCDTLYSYMNDDHIYTALKAICPVVVDPRPAGQARFPATL